MRPSVHRPAGAIRAASAALPRRRQTSADPVDVLPLRFFKSLLPSYQSPTNRARYTGAAGRKPAAMPQRREQQPPRRASPRLAAPTAEPSHAAPPCVRASSAPAELQLPPDQPHGPPALGCIKRRYAFFVGLAVGVLAPVSSVSYIWRAELSAGVSLGVGHVTNLTNRTLGAHCVIASAPAFSSPPPSPSSSPCSAP